MIFINVAATLFYQQKMENEWLIELEQMIDGKRLIIGQIP